MFNKLMSNRLCPKFIILLILILILIHNSIASHLKKKSSHIVSGDSSETSEKRDMYDMILDADNLEAALKRFLEVWDETHGTKYSGAINTTNNLISNKTNHHLVVDKSSSNNSLELSGWQSDSTNSGSTHSGSAQQLTQIMLNSWTKQLNKYNNLEFEDENSSINCSRCVLHEEAKSRRLENIKVNILNKLGLKVAPNITGKLLPRIPPLHHLLDRYNMLGDDPRVSGPQMLNSFMEDHDHIQDKDRDDFEEFFVNAERSISFAQNRKYYSILSKIQSNIVSIKCSIVYVKN